MKRVVDNYRSLMLLELLLNGSIFILHVMHTHSGPYWMRLWWLRNNLISLYVNTYTRKETLFSTKFLRAHNRLMGHGWFHNILGMHIIAHLYIFFVRSITRLTYHHICWHTWTHHRRHNIYYDGCFFFHFFFVYGQWYISAAIFLLLLDLDEKIITFYVWTICGCIT